ncbi:DNA polymerase III subunit delta' [Kordiimonas pumila]|uniref:DNA polymerase III subunit delta n=1 Tax=Kordiimonas pumila TaxID=2161677 RepID=A0ABV7D2H2_9PROT|nr:DNA polymerase III subunit delta' [Kordiimonas pumila]
MTEDVENNHPCFTRGLTGHEHAERQFLDAFNADRLHHAWLISGPKGIGKATLAWKFAKFLLTQPSSEDEGESLFGDVLPTEVVSLTVSPENNDLQRIESGGHGGLITIERTINDKTGKLRSDIVIDDIRRLIRFFEQTSAEGGWRVAIIDAVDEMNTNASNALLKVLEEPPSKSIILLIAHSPGKLLPTIRSRCRALKLKNLHEDSVKAVLAGKYPALSNEELLATARLANGAPGRAIELASLGGINLYTKIYTILETLPRLNRPQVHALAEQLAALKADAEYRLFIQLFLGWLERMVRIRVHDGDTTDIIPGEKTQMARISTLAGVDQWLDLWEKMGNLAERANAVNLDKKQIIISMFTTLAAVAYSQ